MVSYEGLDGLLILFEMSQDQVKCLFILVVVYMSMCFDVVCGDLYVIDDVKLEEICKIWEKVVVEILCLDVILFVFE